MDNIGQVVEKHSAEDRWIVRHTIWDILQHWTPENKKEIAKKISVRIAEVKTIRAKWESSSR